MLERQDYLRRQTSERVQYPHWRNIHLVSIIVASAIGGGYAASYSTHVVDWLNQFFNRPSIGYSNCTNYALLTDANLRQSRVFTAGVEFNGEPCTIP